MFFMLAWQGYFLFSRIKLNLEFKNKRKERRTALQKKKIKKNKLNINMSISKADINKTYDKLNKKRLHFFF